ncbi:MAG TPA: TM0106 family RecB-like putative nuclease [Jiangellaceae bacterium]|nr:TM0106 family RecB-like putative nuclease [Jiangellaceae bacterium]
MYVVDGRMVLSPTDLVGHLACPHLTTLEREVAFGLRPPPDGDDAGAALIRTLGDAHERSVVDEMRNRLDVVEIPRTDDLPAAEQLTLDAMKRGADVVYQATFFDGRWRGHADFLIRNDQRPSGLGDWSYDVADTKLARHLKVGALLQMGVYAGRLETLQSAPPESLTVILGSGEHVSVPHVDVAAYTRRTVRDFEHWLDDAPTTYPVRVPHCDICPWAQQCRQRWRADDDLVLVPQMRRSQREQFREAGIGTVTRLGAATEADLSGVGAVGDAARRKLAAQARLQVAARALPVPPHEPVLPVEAGRGLTLLPEPDAGDLFLDLEGDPFYGDEGIEYLWGVTDMGDEFTAWWAHDPAAERRAFEQAVDHLMATWERHPGMHVYHYASYEPTVLKRLSQRYGTRLDEVDALLRGERLVDLYAVVRQGLRIGVESYSIKSLEQLYSPAARAGAQVKDAGSSIVEYERWRQQGEQSILDAIGAYNRDDCISTRRLREWLEARRDEVRAAGHDVPRPDGSVVQPAEHYREPDPEFVAAEAALTAGVPDDPTARTADQHTRALLANLLQWHRRENRAEWWEYFRVRKLTLDELVDDPATLGGLCDPVLVRQEKRSGVWRYRVPPQECRIRLGDRVDHARPGGAGSSELVGLDLEQGWVELKRALVNVSPHPAGLLPPSPVDARVPAAALLRVGRWVVDHGLEADGPYRGVRDLLLGLPPRLPDGVALRHDGEDGVRALYRVARHLRGALPVQGPPGSGKTYAGAHAILELVRSGRTVGISALSHRVITHLLDAVMTLDDRSGRLVRAVQKADDDASTHDRVTVTSSNTEVETALALGTANVVAGTSWLFARDGVHVDVLVVDEAGQLSLANAVSAGVAADGLILLGDPQQLPQPAHGIHPDGTGVSALEHALGEHDTVPPDRGLFLETTRRMHPAVCTPVSALSYEGRLRPHAGLENQVVGGEDELAGAGLRWRPVRHTGRSVESAEEIGVVAELVDRLAGRPWTDTTGTTHTLGPDDILVVAPYNAQVARLLARLRGRALVGTVDKFQGQQAPVVIVSLTTSSAADAPRGVHFVANRNRLNVAVSRARSLAVLVGSPALLSSPVTSLEQLRGVNALCTLVEAST